MSIGDDSRFLAGAAVAHLAVKLRLEVVREREGEGGEAESERGVGEEIVLEQVRVKLVWVEWQRRRPISFFDGFSPTSSLYFCPPKLFILVSFSHCSFLSTS